MLHERVDGLDDVETSRQTAAFHVAATSNDTAVPPSRTPAPCLDMRRWSIAASRRSLVSSIVALKAITSAACWMAAGTMSSSGTSAPSISVS